MPFHKFNTTLFDPSSFGTPAPVQSRRLNEPTREEFLAVNPVTPFADKPLAERIDISRTQFEEDPTNLSNLFDLLFGESERVQGESEAATQRGIDTLGAVKPELQGLTDDNLASIQALQSFIRNQFDPVRGQFQSLIDEPAISQSVQQGLLNNIRSGFGTTLGTAQRDITNSLAARGLGNSSILGRELINAQLGATRGRLGAESTLRTGVEDINRRSQESATRGLGTLTGIESQIGTNILGLETGVRDRLAGRLTGIAGGQAGLEAGQEFILNDFIELLGIGQGQELLDLSREQFEFEKSPEALLRSFLEGILPNLIGAAI